jgi:hypothetical protein
VIDQLSASSWGNLFDKGEKKIYSWTSASSFSSSFLNCSKSLLI